MSQTVVSSQLVPGAKFLDKYLVDRLLGEGGMGIVFAATHVELQDRVAIKLLRPEATGNSEIVTRFLREARAAAKLRSENVVRVYDVGRLDSGEPYMVMELLDGNDLASGPLGPALPVDEAVDYVIQACDAMIVAHELGMVHRDLKPANLFLTVDRHGVPVVKVLDFGISKLKQSGPLDGALTHESAVMGSPLYMSPEQVRSAKTVDARADIWSLGTILYELITGRTPFEGETLGAILSAVAVDTPPPMASLRPDVPPGLEAIVTSCLEKDPAHRFQTAADLQTALLPFGSLRSQAKMALRGSVMPPTQVVVSSAPPGPLVSGSSLPPPPAVAQTNTTWADTASGSRPAAQAPPQSGKRRSGMGVLAAVAILLVGGGGLAVWISAPFTATVSSTTAVASEQLSAAPSVPVEEASGAEPPAPTPALSASTDPSASPASARSQVAPPAPRVARPTSSPAAPARTVDGEPSTSTPPTPAPATVVPPVAARPVAAPPVAAPPKAVPAPPRNDSSSPLDIDFK